MPVIVALLVITSGCLGGGDKPEVKVDILLMGLDEQNVVMGNNTTFLFAIENNWKENATLTVSLDDSPDDWETDLFPTRATLDKYKGTSVHLNITVPRDVHQIGYDFRVTVKGEGDSAQKKSVTVTVYALDPTVSPELEVVEPGGPVVYVNYTGFLTNGLVFDTNHENTSLSNSIDKIDDYQDPVSFGPTPFKPGKGEMIPGFEAGLNGMRKGEGKAIFVHEDDTYSHWETVNVSVTEDVPLREEWSTNEFKRAFREEPSMYLTVTHRKWNWTAQVVAIAADEDATVTIELQVQPGDVTHTYGWKSVVLSVDSTANGGVGVIVLDNDPSEDGPQVGGDAQIYNSTAPKEYDYGTVTGITDTTITTRIQQSHHKLAGMDLIFYIQVVRFGA